MPLVSDFPPLLSAGFHPMTPGQVKELCVARFPDSRRRPLVFAGLSSFLAELSSAGVKGEVWIDGSFVTEKLEPADCDLVVCADGALLDIAAPAMQDFLRRRFDTERAQVKAAYHCDVYIFPEYPASHMLHGISLQRRAYWQKQFGFDRSKQPKGMAVVTLPVQP
jgi:hypothetical protein